MKIDMDKKYKTRSGEPVRVLCIDGANQKYPVIIERRDGLVYHYTSEGCYDSRNNHYDLIEVSPYEDFKVDDKVMVRATPCASWTPRHFAGIDDKGNALCFFDGKTSFTGKVCYGASSKSMWAYCRKPLAEELGE